MRAAFLIDRPTQYRLLGPAIDEALGRGWHVECWHDERVAGHFQKSDGDLGGTRPPRFRRSGAVTRPYYDTNELDQRLRGDADVVVSIGTEPYYFRSGRTGARPRWVWLQYLSDFLHHLGPDDLLDCDVAAFHSRWWIDWTAESFQVESRVPDAAAFEAALSRQSVVVGVPEIDAVSAIDPDEVRARWRIPAGKPVVVLLPFPQGVGKAAFWPRHIFNEPSRLRQFGEVVMRRRFEFLPDIMHGWNDRNVVRAIREFCDRNDAFLLVKSRPKTPIPAYLEACADLTMYDESHYPATILEALSIASLCVSFYSSAVTEAVPLGVPHLCVAFDMANYFDVDATARARALRLYNRQPGGMYQWEGAAWTVGIDEAIGALPSKTLDDYAMQPAARRTYVEKFMTCDDRRASVRLLDAIESR
jgi:hypothetical protein